MGATRNGPVYARKPTDKQIPALAVFQAWFREVLAGRRTFGASRQAVVSGARIRAAHRLAKIEKVLGEGLRTADLMGQEGMTPVGTTGLGDAVLKALDASL